MQFYSFFLALKTHLQYHFTLNHFYTSPFQRKYFYYLIPSLIQHLYILYIFAIFIFFNFWPLSS
ncbi:unnamed protein product [Meloidogyne enterolobii]|uniref:Uncharacterized protein n=1 Tax=Meloidogyne enterolobii TaxID=390850 RepID=A0ACB0ZZC8_MELEN